ncbi:ribosomal protein S18-alanine N-acetyltransferase [Psychrosphaera sp. 1_MG-2023]|uniref:ribosomal protein S18-alanine N-acetyltransferase n=1 Tax=Psychrosphaera sp. 1_MG-2023 TaxID=3062643 RepID=UPI0026E268D5|nr:ribosomal protein S18-alanine N-acetyltransferase [Psychrosphaera sp. 1_MG-2023]MDO6718788.1 ribosomal protein S18-alanine N-acetyltransferase [Psychrosphaera sp. 1_MG-2023]
MKIIELNLSHISQIVSVEQQSHLTPWSEKTIEGSFGSRSHNFGLFKKAKPLDELVGYCFTDLVAGELSIENICIAKQHQNKGHGGQLLGQVLEQAVVLNADQVFLEVRASNQAAIALYHRYGFVECGRRKQYYSIPDSNLKEDAIMMSLKLG